MAYSSPLEVARYFLSKVDPSSGEGLSNLKLQKLVYMAQGFALAALGDELFSDEIEAWSYGPVVPSLYHEFKSFKSDPVPPADSFDPDSIPAVVRELLDEVYQVYAQYSAWRLAEITHQHPTWLRREPGQVIPKTEMRAHFRTLLDDGPTSTPA